MVPFWYQGVVLTKRILTSIAVVALIGTVSCSSQPAAKTESAAQTPPASQSAPPASAMAQAQPPGGGQNATPQTATGVVLETMNAANYTYVRVKADGGEFWAATSQFKVAVGDRVVVPLETPMQDFQSPSLKRTFPLIYFVSRISREGEAAQPPAMMSGHGSTPTGAPAAAATQEPINVAPAPGGMTIADVWSKRKTLGGKTITIRGKVVKFNSGILGVNWVHLQDGTGAAKDGTNDITVTSQAPAKVGEVVTITGKIALDKDLGSGYSYPVIVEGATIIVK